MLTGADKYFTESLYWFCEGRESVNRKILGVAFVVLLVIVALSVLCFDVGWKRANAVVVPDDYSTIQEAIDAANVGDAIYVRAGAYHEHVLANKTVSLLGEGSNVTVIDGDGDGTVVNVVSENVSVRGFRIQNGEVGLRVNSSGNTIMSNTFSNNGAQETDFAANLEVYPGPPASPVWFYLYDLMDGNYTEILTLTTETPVLRVQVSGYSDVAQLMLGLFLDENLDGIPQLHEFVGVASRDKITWTELFDPPLGQYIIKVQGYDVMGNPGHFDREITRYTGYGLGMHDGFNCTISENLIADNYAGLYLQGCSSISVRGNSVTRNWGGIIASNVADSDIQGNDVYLNSYGDEFTSALSIRSGRNINVTGNTLSSNAFGVNLWNSSLTNIEDNWLHNHTGWSIGLHASYGNKIARNNISNSTGLDGIRLVFSYDNTLVVNDITGCEHSGILLWYDCFNNTVAENRIQSSGSQGWGHGHGIEVLLSYDNVFSGNKISNVHNQGIIAIETSGNNFTQNTVSFNRKGIVLRDSAGNRVYHNGLIGNWEQQASEESGNDFWDAGYPLGGNFWSDCSGSDVRRGSYQDEPNGDGLCDEPYDFNGGKDDYPLMKPYGGSHDLGVRMTVSKTIIAAGYNTTVTIDVTVVNFGVQAEDFSLMFQAPGLSYDETLNLSGRNSQVLTFMCNMTLFSEGTYIVMVNVSQVMGEDDLADNAQWRQILVTIAGDVTSAAGPPEGKVDMRDVSALCLRFGSTLGDENWDVNFDINYDGRVNMRDISIACANFGKI